MSVAIRAAFAHSGVFDFCVLICVSMLVREF